MVASYNLNENLGRAVRRFGKRVAIESEVPGHLSSLTYEQLYERVKSVAFFLSRQGVKKGDRALVILENRPEYAVIFFALSYLGAVSVPLDPQFREKDVRNIASDSGATLAFVSKDNKSAEFLKSMEGLNVVIIEDVAEKKAPQDFQSASIEPDDLILILYTSGTTDLPKGVMLTHKNLCSNFEALDSFKLFSQKDVVLSILPLYHSYAIMATFIVPFFSGAKIVYVSGDWPDRLTDYLRKTRTTIFIGVPQLFHMMHARIFKKLRELPVFAKLYIRLVTGMRLARFLLPGFRNAIGKDIRFFISGGAKLDASVSGDFYKLGFKILEGYGLTETSPVVSLNPLHRLKIGSAGRPVPGVRVKIRNPDTEGIGEIAIQGPNVMKGYYRDEKKTGTAIEDGWFLSGDLGHIDEQGYIYVTGRSKEVIVLSSGKNIYPEEIEKHYSAASYVKEMCVLGVQKSKGAARTELLHAVVVPDLEFFKEQGEISIRRAITNNFENLSGELPSYKRIVGFTITKEDLPRTVLGKIKRYEVEKKYLSRILEGDREEEEAGREETELAQSKNAVKLVRCIKEALDITSEVRLNDSIELDLGVDSLSRVELVCAIEDCFDVELSEEMVGGEIFTVKDILLRIEDMLRAKGRMETASQREHIERALSWPEILRQGLPEDFRKKILLHPGLFDHVLTFLVTRCINIFFRIFYRLRVKGANNLPAKGPYALCVNHSSFFDGFIIASAVPLGIELNLFFIAFRKYFMAPIIRNLVSRARIIPIDAARITEAMQASYFILEHKKVLCIFPEGERSLDGQLKEFKKGIGIIAKELNVPLVPVFIKGAFEAWPRTERLPRLYPIEISFGQPLQPAELAGKGALLGAKDEYEAIALGLKFYIHTMLGCKKTGGEDGQG